MLHSGASLQTVGSEHNCILCLSSSSSGPSFSLDLLMCLWGFSFLSAFTLKETPPEFPWPHMPFNPQHLHAHGSPRDVSHWDLPPKVHLRSHWICGYHLWHSMIKANTLKNLPHRPFTPVQSTATPLFLLLRTKVLGSTFFFFFFFFFCLFSAAPMAYGGSQARGQIRAIVTGLHHSHSNLESEAHLRPPPQLMAMLDQPTEQGQRSNLCPHKC